MTRAARAREINSRVIRGMNVAQITPAPQQMAAVYSVLIAALSFDCRAVTR